MSTATADLDADAKNRCSAWARAASLSPIGTSGCYRGYLLVEIPLPWPRDIKETAAAASISALIEPVGYRLQALVPPGRATPPESHRVILHARRPEENGFSGYRRFETVAGSSLEAAVASLIAAAAGDSPLDLESPATDVLVCTHGRRDVCCGKRGTDLALRLAKAGPRSGDNLWRTSHTGGHRFAPTFLVLPQGTAWAFADTDLVEAVCGQTVDFTEVADHYRGCAGLEGPQVQALEHAVLRLVGWEILGRPRRGTFDGSRARLWWEEDGETVMWGGDVHPGRTIPMPDCMQSPATATKLESEWAVSAVRRL